MLCLQAFLLILKSGKGVTVCVSVTARILFVYTYFICVSLHTRTFVCVSAFVCTYEWGIYKKSKILFLMIIFYCFPLLNHHPSQKRSTRKWEIFKGPCKYVVRVLLLNYNSCKHDIFLFASCQFWMHFSHLSIGRPWWSSDFQKSVFHQHILETRLSCIICHNMKLYKNIMEIVFTLIIHWCYIIRLTWKIFTITSKRQLNFDKNETGSGRWTSSLPKPSAYVTHNATWHPEILASSG